MNSNVISLLVIAATVAQGAASSDGFAHDGRQIQTDLASSARVGPAGWEDEGRERGLKKGSWPRGNEENSVLPASERLAPIAATTSAPQNPGSREVERPGEENRQEPAGAARDQSSTSTSVPENVRATTTQPPHETKPQSPPGMEDLIRTRIYKHFGTEGLIALALVVMLASFWWQWNHIKALPGVKQFLGWLGRRNKGVDSQSADNETALSNEMENEAAPENTVERSDLVGIRPAGRKHSATEGFTFGFKLSNYADRPLRLDRLELDWWLSDDPTQAQTKTKALQRPLGRDAVNEKASIDLPDGAAKMGRTDLGETRSLYNVLNVRGRIFFRDGERELFDETDDWSMANF